MTERYGYDKTPTPPIDYDMSKVPSEIKKRTEWVKSKFTGEDVAEAYRQAGDIAGIYAGEAKRIAEQTQYRQDAVEDFNNQVIQEMTDKDVISAPELIESRDGEVKLSARLERDFGNLSAFRQDVDGIADKVLAEFSERDVNVKWFGAEGDGVTDDTLAIQHAIEFISVKNMNLFFPSGTYLTEEIVISSKNDVHLKGENGAILKNFSQVTTALIKMKDCSNVSISNLSLDCGWNFNRGVELVRNCHGININELRISNVSQATNNINQTSCALYISTNNNNDVLVSNLKIDGVSNNDNGVIGDALGSSRGILVAKDYESDHPVLVKNVKFVNIDIKNIISEDGDAVHVQGHEFDGVKSPEINIEFKDISIDNCSRRGFKIQSCHGVKADGVKIRQTDRTFNMTSAIGLFSSGHTLKNVDADVKSVNGVAIEFFQNDDFETILDWINITLDNVKTISGSSVYGIDIRTPVGVTADNVHFSNIRLLTPNSPIILRSFTRNLQLDNCELHTYQRDIIAISASFPITGNGIPKDEVMVSHKNLKISNVRYDTYLMYAAADTIFDTTIIENVQNNSDLNPLMFLKDLTGNVQCKPTILYSKSIPTEGFFYLGDYCYYANKPLMGNVGSKYYLKGWLRVTDGNSHVLGVDWIEDKLYTGG